MLSARVIRVEKVDRVGFGLREPPSGRRRLRGGAVLVALQPVCDECLTRDVEEFHDCPGPVIGKIEHQSDIHGGLSPSLSARCEMPGVARFLKAHRCVEEYPQQEAVRLPGAESSGKPPERGDHDTNAAKAPWTLEFAPAAITRYCVRIAAFISSYVVALVKAGSEVMSSRACLHWTTF